MKSSRMTSWPRAALFSLGLMVTTAVGCQSTIGGQTMPSATYLLDDVQYFIAGPEDRLPNQRRVIADYNLKRQQNAAGDFDAAGP